MSWWLVAAYAGGFATCAALAFVYMIHREFYR